MSGVWRIRRDATSAASLRATGAICAAFAAACAFAQSSTGDLNGDGKADVLLRHSDGRWYYSAMDGRRRIADASGSVALPTETEYRLAGIGDFNGDGMDDVMLRRDDTNRWYYYPMDGREVLEGQGEVAMTRNADWRFLATGDLNGDGRDDVLLRHAKNHRWYYYPMDGRSVAAGRGTANLTRGRLWRFKAIADLNGDGKDDVLVRNANGRWYYYPMDGRRVVAGRGYANLTDNVDWRFAGAGDFNADTKDDVLLRRPDGRWYYYPMDGRRYITGEQRVASITPNLDWRFAGIGDFNADGKDDVLLRRFDGRWYYYPMDGYRNIAAERGIASLYRNLAWSLAYVPIVRTNQFVESALSAGLSRRWGYPPRSGQFSGTFPLEFSGGIAAGDYDGDGDVDLYVVGGSDEPNHLFRNRGDGTFYDTAARVGLDITHLGSGPAFGDIDGDGDLDLFIGAVENDPYYLMENRDGEFVDVTVTSGIIIDAENTVSATFADYDQDDDLDLFLSHWGFGQQDDTQTVWRNTGDGIFESASVESGIAESLIIESLSYQTGEIAHVDRTYTANLSDIDNDGDGDLLMAADYETSQVFANNGDGTFTLTTDRDVVVDQSGMGASVGDYDNDGDMDWFVTSIYQVPNFYGNRLYRNDGTGVFEDVTVAAGVRDGGWGWASCFADIDNDGDLDIVHVNGWRGDTGFSPALDFLDDQMRYFENNGNGTFKRRDTLKWLRDRGQGRGLACFDAERDGDIDLVVTNSDDRHLVYYRNELADARNNHFIGIKLERDTGNRHGVGAWITVTTSAGAQVREVGAGNNYASQNPSEAHFGLGAYTVADIVVRWPDGTLTTMDDVWADQWLTIR